MPLASTDVYGHEISTGGPQLTAGAVGVTTVGTISGTTNAGASPTVTVTDCTDQRGSFLLNPVTGGGAQAAGSVATVKFLKEYGRTPIVVVNLINETDGTSTIVASPGTVTGAGFTVFVGTALTTAKAYRVNYLVFPAGTQTAP
jgi:hypothetical protein